MERMLTHFTSAYKRDWSWQLNAVTVQGTKVVCVGNLLIKDGPAYGGMAVIGTEDAADPFVLAEVLAMEAAAYKAGFVESVLHGALAASPDLGQKFQPETQIKEPMTTNERAVELKTAYRMETKAHFLEFVRIHRPEIQSFEEVTPAVIDEVHAVAVANPERFSGFTPTALV